MLQIIERENHIYKLPDGFDLAKDDDNMYHFTYCLPNDDDGYGIGFRGPFDTILLAAAESWNSAIEFGLNVNEMRRR